MNAGERATGSARSCQAAIPECATAGAQHFPNAMVATTIPWPSRTLPPCRPRNRAPQPSQPFQAVQPRLGRQHLSQRVPVRCHHDGRRHHQPDIPPLPVSVYDLLPFWGVQSQPSRLGGYGRAARVWLSRIRHLLEFGALELLELAGLVRKRRWLHLNHLTWMVPGRP